VVIHINVFPFVLVNCENLVFYKSVSQLEYLKPTISYFTQLEEIKVSHKLTMMAHMLLKFIASEMSQNLVPTFQSLDQLNVSTGGIADVSYLPRANKFSSKNIIHLQDTYSSQSNTSLKSLISKAFALKSN
jgi:hypothetical protein